MLKLWGLMRLPVGFRNSWTDFMQTAIPSPKKSQQSYGQWTYVPVILYLTTIGLLRILLAVSRFIPEK